MSTTHDDYKRLDLGAYRLERCPVCGAAAELWQYSESDAAPTSKAGMCSRSDAIGPRDEFVSDGCLLLMPPQDFYRATIREAVAYWNAFAAALVAMRASEPAA